jgi:hypothetical protein
MRRYFRMPGVKISLVGDKQNCQGMTRNYLVQSAGYNET